MDSLTLAQIAPFANGVLSAGNRDAMVSRISTDSRTLQAGDLFVPLRGDNFDGHKFVQQATERGAVGAMVEEKWDGSAPHHHPRRPPRRLDRPAGEVTSKKFSGTAPSIR